MRRQVEEIQAKKITSAIVALSLEPALNDDTCTFAARTLASYSSLSARHFARCALQELHQLLKSTRPRCFSCPLLLIDGVTSSVQRQKSVSASDNGHVALMNSAKSIVAHVQPQIKSKSILKCAR
mmetsp:Transcript_12023/g.32385  ORF Transcript_12023/g.32385 Transcript_12023/m.32385 type:complete len:125 (+) Transcript_12023:419-793(+)